MKPHFINKIPRFADSDVAGMIYFANFATYFDESFRSAMRTNQITFDTYQEMEILIPIVESQVKFLNPIRVEDKIRIYCATTELREKFIKTNHVITKISDVDEKVVATGYLSRVCIDMREFKSMEIPEKMRTSLQKYMMVKDEWENFVSSFD